MAANDHHYTSFSYTHAFIILLFQEYWKSVLREGQLTHNQFGSPNLH